MLTCYNDNVILSCRWCFADNSSTEILNSVYRLQNATTMAYTTEHIHRVNQHYTSHSLSKQTTDLASQNGSTKWWLMHRNSMQCTKHSTVRALDETYSREVINFNAEKHTWQVLRHHQLTKKETNIYATRQHRSAWKLNTPRSAILMVPDKIMALRKVHRYLIPKAHNVLWTTIM